jgi:hypothetical protein
MKMTSSFKLLIFLIFPILLSLTSCDPYSQDDYEENVVVQAYLVADERFPIIKLSLSSSISEKYDFDQRSIAGASVTIEQINAAGTVQATMAYRMLKPGVYGPIDTLRTVEPLTRYRLKAQIQGKPEVSAHTLVPDRFQTVGLNNTRIKYQSTEQFEIDITLSSYPGRQNIYIFSIETLDPENAEFTPFYADVVDEEDRADFYLNSSGIVFEGNYEVDRARNILRIKLPWLGIAFYGPNRITANVIDDAMYDYIRTVNVQQGGSTLSPGEINNIKTNIVNGTGVFGSYAKSSVVIFVDK